MGPGGLLVVGEFHKIRVLDPLLNVTTLAGSGAFGATDGAGAEPILNEL